ncbi:MAG TPA: hypothetical protein PLL30_00435 [Candidatus Krumholzibacteria bacterium]|nr:hypothetical protein [Candidatus Krumholzibacteria bacterium]HPD70226.1 hypothetical protein [Candidatus Krumholzibacteria bacterium]HRY40074.1 hypothetical protein [Candidatus Krumholzibacteria bacterium]
MKRTLLVVTLTLLLVAADLAALAAGPPVPRRPPKAASIVTPAPPEPDRVRQGGDTFADAILITDIGLTYTGTTVGFTDDYDEACPYAGSDSPDVVYRYAPASSQCLQFDLYGSTYDTKIYIYRENLTVVACNDDFYADYVSRITGVILQPGVKYYIVIDGWGGEAGAFVLNISEYVPCEIGCDEISQEYEPPLIDGYEDTYNGGCNSVDFVGVPVLQDLNWYGFCGQTGWYYHGGDLWRDTDWFRIPADPSGVTEVGMDADVPCLLWQMQPGECEPAIVLDMVAFGPCQEQWHFFSAAPNSIMWLAVAPASFDPPDPVECDPAGPYEYWLYVAGWDDPVVRVEPRSWAAVKRLFR